jgi:hypothetical protein
MKLLVCALTVTAAFAADSNGFVSGKADLKSAGSLAFNADGVLFVGDSAGAAVWALETNDKSAAPVQSFDVRGLDRKIAAALSTEPDQILVHDVKLHPISRAAYISVSRGRGPDAVPVILRVDGSGAISELALDKIRHAMVGLPSRPSAVQSRRRGNPQAMTITDIAFSDRKLIVAGLSNEDFSSTLRVIPFPFTKADEGATVEIYHIAHGGYETESPVRTFIPYTIAGEPYMLAAYTCTPLVKIALRDLKAGAKVTGASIAELGRHNSPLDMIAYRKDGHSYLLAANTNRGVLRMAADGIETYEEITPDAGIARQMPIKRISDWWEVRQLEKFDESTALVLSGVRGALALYTAPLP